MSSPAPARAPLDPAAVSALTDFFASALPRCGVDASTGEALPGFVPVAPLAERSVFEPPAGTSPLSGQLSVQPEGAHSFMVMLDYSRYPSLQGEFADAEPANLALTYRASSPCIDVYFSFMDTTPAGSDFDMIMADLHSLLCCCPALRSRPLKYTPCIQMGDTFQPVALMRQEGIFDMSEALT